MGQKNCHCSCSFETQKTCENVIVPLMSPMKFLFAHLLIRVPMCKYDLSIHNLMHVTYIPIVVFSTFGMLAAGDKNLD